MRKDQTLLQVELPQFDVDDEPTQPHFRLADLRRADARAFYWRTAALVTGAVAFVSVCFALGILVGA